MGTETPIPEKREIEFNPFNIEIGNCISVWSHNTEYIIEAREDGLYISGHPKICPEPIKIAHIGSGVVGYGWEINKIKTNRPMSVEFDQKSPINGQNKIMTTSPIESIGTQEKVA